MSDCCSSETKLPTPAPTASPKEMCPRCRESGRSVSTLTLKHQVRPRFLSQITGSGFHFCPTSNCDVVYFAPRGLVLTTGDVRRLVTHKDRVNAPACYCFGFTPTMIRDEIASTGKSTVVERIAAEMKSDFCACEIRNPQGSCCLGNVKAAVKAAMTENTVNAFPILR